MRTSTMGWGLALFLAFSASAGAVEVLYKLDGGLLRDGRFGRIIQVQRALNNALSDCGKETKVSADGILGRQTINALKTFATCPAAQAAQIDGDLANGVLTDAAWRVLTGADLPSVRERAMAMVIAFEDTDYGEAQWNFCQNAPRYDPDLEDSVCYSNDQTSYLTWGPNGATAGHGREVLAIVSLLHAENSGADLIDDAFGDEAVPLLQATGLSDSGQNSELERFLCGVWMSHPRRQTWRDGFAALAEDGRLRSLYDHLYQSSNFDGGKVQTYYSVWKEVLGREPTEVDFAFFIDRAAHMSSSEETVRTALEAIIAENDQLTPAEIRQSFSHAVRPTNQRKDRLGRDASFFVDGVGSENLTAIERDAWKQRGSRRASDVGLSDERGAPELVVFRLQAWSPASTQGATADELDDCPKVVLNPTQPAN